MPVVWTVDSFPLASRDVCLPVPLVQEGSVQKKVGRTSSKFEKDDRVTTLPLLPDVLEVLEVNGVASRGHQEVPQSQQHPLHQLDHSKVS